MIITSQLELPVVLEMTSSLLDFFPLENEWVVSHNVSYPFISDSLWLWILGTSNPTTKNYSLLRYSAISPDLLHFNYVDWKVSNFDMQVAWFCVYVCVCLFFQFLLALGYLSFSLWTEAPWNQDKTWVSDEIACKFHTK